MIKFENTEVVGWGAAIRGMRNPMNSWHLGDTDWFDVTDDRAVESDHWLDSTNDEALVLGDNDLDLMKRLRNAGTDHRKFMRMVTVYLDITAPLYWWKEFDTYKVGTVANSCSTMHKIAEKEFTLSDFSWEKLLTPQQCTKDDFVTVEGYDGYDPCSILSEIIIPTLNLYRGRYLETKDKKYWWQMIQLLPSSYNQKRTIMMNYEVLANIYKARRNHKLDEWSENIIKVNGEEYTNKWLPNDEMNRGFCDWIKTLPYSELITGEDE